MTGSSRRAGWPGGRRWRRRGCRRAARSRARRRRVVVDVGDAGAWVRGAGDLVDVAAGGQAGADVEELGYAGLAGEVADSAGQERSVVPRGPRLAGDRGGQRDSCFPVDRVVCPCRRSARRKSGRRSGHPSQSSAVRPVSRGAGSHTPVITPCGISPFCVAALPQVEWLAMATGACRSGSAGRPGEALIRFTQETLRTSRARIQSIWSGPGARPGELTGVHGSGCEGDLAAVTYCDLAGLRAILSLAGAASGGHPGRGCWCSGSSAGTPRPAWS